MSYSTGVRHKEGVTQEGPMIEERLTEDLLARLLAAPNPDSYLGEGLTLQRSLADYLHELLAAKGFHGCLRCVLGQKPTGARQCAHGGVRAGLLAARDPAAFEVGRCGRAVS